MLDAASDRPRPSSSFIQAIEIPNLSPKSTMSCTLVDSSTLQAHVDTCTVCESVYANPGELTFEPETQAVLESLKAHLNNTADLSALEIDLSLRLQKVKALTLSIQLNIEDFPDSPFRISARLPLLMEVSANGLAEFSIQTPAFLSRADGEKLVEELMDAAKQAQADGLTAIDNAGHIMDVVDRITALASTLWQSAEAAREAQLEKKAQDEDDGELQRVWFWFPSLSTREKRKDLVNYAARWGLTGFVLAGMHHSVAFRSSTDRGFHIDRKTRVVVSGRNRSSSRGLHVRHQV